MGSSQQGLAMTTKTRAFFYSLLAISILALSACETGEQLDATATAKAGGVDRDFLSAEAISAAEDGGYDDRLLIIDATATARSGGQDNRLESVYATAEANMDQTATAEALAWDAASSADVNEDEEIDALTPVSGERQLLRRGSDAGTIAASTATPVPAPTPTTVPTPAPTPTEVPTATPEPVNNGPWLTAQEAIVIASAARPGRVESMSGHVSHKAGQKDAGDDANTSPSPGGGYSSSWGVTIVDGGEIFLCLVRNRAAECDTLFSASEGSIESVTSDSTDFLAVWNDDPEWNELIANDNISILMFLNQLSGPNTPITWQAIVTVHSETTGLRGGNFGWTPATGETATSTYK
jgi:hypothetical protein